MHTCTYALLTSTHLWYNYDLTRVVDIELIYIVMYAEGVAPSVVLLCIQSICVCACLSSHDMWIMSVCSHDTCSHDAYVHMLT